MLGDPDIVQNRHLVPQPDILKSARHTKGGHLMRFQSSSRFTANPNFTFSGLVKTAHQVKCRGFSCTVGTNKTGHGIRTKTDIKICYRGQTAKPLDHITDFQNRNGFFYCIVSLHII